MRREIEFFKGNVFLSFLFIVLFCQTALSQVSFYRFDKIESSDSQLNGMINSFGQDSLGFMYFGTLTNLVRYDGIDLELIKTDSNDAFGLITRVFEGNKNDFWINTIKKGFFHYDVKTQKRTNIIIDSTVKKDYIEASVHNDTTTWFYTMNSKLFEMDLSGTMRQIDIPYISRAKESHTLKRYKDELIIVQDSSIFFYHIGSKEWSTYQERFNKSNAPKINNYIIDIQINNEFLVWSETDRVIRYNYNKNQSEEWSIKNSPNLQRINDIEIDNKNNIWVATYGFGLVRIDAINGKIQTFKSNKFDDQSIVYDFIFKLYSDDDGRIWIGTLRGISHINPTNMSIKYINPDVIPMVHSHASINNVFDMHLDNDSSIWVGATAALSKINLSTGMGEIIEVDPENHLSNAIDDIYESKDGTLWLGTHNGLYYLDRIQDKFIRDDGYVSGDDSQRFFITELNESSDGLLWISTWGAGVFAYNRTTKESMHLINNHQIYNTKNINDTLYFASNLGLYYWDEVHLKLNYVQTPIQKNIIIDIEYSKGSYWLCGDHEIYKSDLKSNFQKIDLLDFETHLYGLKEDVNGMIWILSDDGLMRLNQETNETHLLTKIDGLQENEFNSSSYIEADNGDLFFGGVNGISWFHPNEISFNHEFPKIALTHLSIFNKKQTIESSSILNYEINHENEIHLSHNDNMFTLGFTAFGYGHMDNIKYAYKLEGFDNEFLETPKQQRSATYTNLSAGSYTFYIKAKDGSENWGPSYVAATIVIHPPFWNTIWFKLTSLLLIAAFIVMIIKRRTYKLHRDREILQEMVLEKTKDLREEKDKLLATLEKLNSTQNKLIESEKMASLGQLTAGIAHEINNSINYVQGAVTGLEMYLGDMNKSLTNAATLDISDSSAHQKWLKSYKEKNFSHAVEELLDCIKVGAKQSTEIVKGLKSYARMDQLSMEKANLNEIIKSTLLIARKEAMNVVDINFKPGSLQIFHCHPSKLSQVFLNLTINAIHAIEETGEIHIETCVTKRNNLPYIKTIIKDNGKGIKKETINKIFDPFFTTKGFGKGSGLGLSISLGIIKDHGGEIEVESQLDIGTTFTIYLPA